MELIVNIDAGFALNTKAIAALVRNRDNPEHTDIILVSGNKFIAIHPLSFMVECLSKENHEEQQ